MLSFMSSVYILHINPLSDKNFPNFCLYVLLIVSFTIQKLFCLIYSHCLFLFPLLKKAYQKYNVNQYQRTYCPYFPKGVFMVSGLTFKPLVHILSLFFVHGFFVHIAALFMPANLENSAVATGWEKVSFHSNLKERQCQRMLKFSSITQSCPTLCDPVDCSTPGLPVHHQFIEFTQTHIH